MSLFSPDMRAFLDSSSRGGRHRPSARRPFGSPDSSEMDTCTANHAAKPPPGNHLRFFAGISALKMGHERIGAENLYPTPQVLLHYFLQALEYKERVELDQTMRLER
jgi:hypothetical protein